MRITWRSVTFVSLFCSVNTSHLRTEITTKCPVMSHLRKITHYTSTWKLNVCLQSSITLINSKTEWNIRRRRKCLFVCLFACSSLTSLRLIVTVIDKRLLNPNCEDYINCWDIGLPGYFPCFVPDSVYFQWLYSPLLGLGHVCSFLILH
jgi:hypothetical protein